MITRALHTLAILFSVCALKPDPLPSQEELCGSSREVITGTCGVACAMFHLTDQRARFRARILASDSLEH